FPLGEVLQILHGHDAPILNHAAEIGRLAKIKAGIEFRGNLNGAPAGDDLHPMRLAGTANGEVRRRGTQVHAVQFEELGKVSAVDDGEHVQPVDAGDYALGFDVGKPTGINDHFFSPGRF